MAKIVSFSEARTKHEKGRPVQVFQIKVTLKGSKPPIWRRLLVPSDISLPDLHDVFQTAMGWHHCHLHQYMKGNTYYSEPNPEFADDAWFEILDETKYRLRDLVVAPKQRCRYEYDFGDGWEHNIMLERIAEADKKYPGHPVCLKGAMACPPEDCGGIWGYYDLLKVINDPNHPEHEEMKNWLGEFDPTAFDIEDVNRRLAGMNL